MDRPVLLISVTFFLIFPISQVWVGEEQTISWACDLPLANFSGGVSISDVVMGTIQHCA